MPACPTRIDTQKGDLEVSPWGLEGSYRRPALEALLEWRNQAYKALEIFCRGSLSAEEARIAA
eukprot:3918994-Amphidinium_carterae.1